MSSGVVVRSAVRRSAAEAEVQCLAQCVRCGHVVRRMKHRDKETNVLVEVLAVRYGDLIFELLLFFENALRRHGLYG